MKKLAIILAVVALLSVGCVFVFRDSGHPAPIDGDKASDCWAHADKQGRRHCATAVAPRFGSAH